MGPNRIFDSFERWGPFPGPRHSEPKSGLSPPPPRGWGGVESMDLETPWTGRRSTGLPPSPCPLPQPPSLPTARAAAARRTPCRACWTTRACRASHRAASSSSSARSRSTSGRATGCAIQGCGWRLRCVRDRHTAGRKLPPVPALVYLILGKFAHAVFKSYKLK